MVKKHSKRRNNKSKRKYSKKRVSYKSKRKYSKKKQKGGAKDESQKRAEAGASIIKNLTDHTNSFEYIEPEEGDSITDQVIKNRGAINLMVPAHENHHERINVQERILDLFEGTLYTTFDLLDEQEKRIDKLDKNRIETENKVISAVSKLSEKMRPVIATVAELVKRDR